MEMTNLNRNTMKRLIALSLVVAFSFMVVSPLFAQAQTIVPGGPRNGPYIDNIVFDVITNEDQAILALQNDEIDVFDGMVDAVYIPQLEEAESVNVEYILRNGYGYLTINTAKYPLNNTALRRAMAFALDKEAISDDVWEGLSQPQDSVVPATNPWSIEGQLPYTYYEANVALGNDLLDAAGFDIPEGEEYRRAPDGSEFDLLIECASSSEVAIEIGHIMAEACEALHINARSEPTDFYEYLYRLYYHGDYDMVFLGGTYTQYDVDWLAYNYGSEWVDLPQQNFPNFRNASFDAWIDQLLHGTTYEEVYEAAIEMQKIWVYECPMIICYENLLMTAHRTDRFEGWVNDPISGIPSWWTNKKVHLKASEGGPFGGTLRWSNSLDIDTFNFMASNSVYANNINNELWDSLITLDQEGNDMLWLVEAYRLQTHEDNPQIPNGHTRITFDILQNATWTDGNPLTAEDVAFTLNFLREAPGNPFGPDLADMIAAYAPTPYQCVIEFDTESYWHLHDAGYKPVLPKHIFEAIGAENWNQWSPVPPGDEIVSSGPFTVTEYVAGEFTELTRNPDYFYGLDRETTTPTEPYTPEGPDLTLAIVAGAVGAAVIILIGGYVLLRRQ
jgi:peptide/nickel transport system substrate-binding protein